MPESATNDPVVAALLRERAGYVTRGLDERVAQVDEQLKARGYRGDTPEESPGEVPKARRAPAKRTTKG